ncbi:constitutive coactivator of PPAR-gamma-like protein 1 isoform X2 [Homalodisca vitripennis]|uniref:constitutive coactivator of PPAR-gamma-like protein 1 isoform X2 n=1 Tax=Homalodisca vitripennis TaxID=197043 RepID=UPI001EEC8545|nr:constitutive coactivator of PPAR-gamma-like protein 1 isoform X2 [Homalodisca vitripennis]
MGIQDLQTFLESGAIPESCVGVDLVRIAKTVSQRLVKQAQKKGGSPLTKFSLVVDGECCLDRLYGGYFSDWACGGQWNRMVSFLAQFVSSLQKANIDLVVFFNGCTEPQRMAEWIVSQQRTRQRVNQVLKHVSTKGTPPPKVWWTSPVCLRTAIRMVLRHLNVAVVCTMDDHKQEVIAYCRENNFHGLIADDAEYVAFDPPRYFSARQLKLTYKGSLESKEYILPELVKGLGLSSDKVCVLAALLGNYILPEHELADVYKKAGISQMPGKIPGDVLIKQLAEKIKDLQNVDNIEDTATAILGSPTDLRLSKLKQSIQYYLDGTKDGFLRYRPSTTVKKGRGNKSKNDIMEKAGAIEESLQEPDLDTSKLASETAESEKSSKSDSEGKKDKVSITLPTVPPEVMRTVSERHNKGLMSPCIYQILTQGEIKLPVVMEDESHKEIPSIHHFYRPVRQMVYAILFNLHHHNYMATRSKDSKADAKPPDVRIREWIWTKSNQYQRADIVPAEQIGWGVPTIQRLWFGTTIDDKRRRLRAFLTCMRSDTALMLNPDYVPQHLLIMATVLRYMMSFPEKKVLRKPELDAFITTAIMPELMNAELNQDLQLQVVSSRGVQLATMFMQGVETALLVNDACGAPVPWLMCCPWLFFDGKLFHHQLSRAAVVKNIMELCNHRIRMVMKVERMRQAVLEGLNVQFARPPIPGIVQGAGPRVHPNMGPPNMMPPGLISNAHPGAGRGLALRGGLSQRGLPRRPLSTNQGGRLEIAGVVVGSWGPNYGLAPIGVGRSVMVQPQVTSVGGLGGYGDPMYRGSNRPTFNPRNPIKGKGRGFRPLTKKRMMPPTGGKREPTKKTTKGRGMSVVLPATGETVFATDVIDDKQKKILMNKDVSEKKMGLLSGTEQLMNGGAGDASSVQFEDATDHVDIPGMNGEGDGPMGVKQILAAAKVDN